MHVTLWALKVTPLALQEICLNSRRSVIRSTLDLKHFEVRMTRDVSSCSVECGTYGTSNIPKPAVEMQVLSFISIVLLFVSSLFGIRCKLCSLCQHDIICFVCKDVWSHQCDANVFDWIRVSQDGVSPKACVWIAERLCKSDVLESPWKLNGI